jgi:hypothetical protein
LGNIRQRGVIARPGLDREGAVSGLNLDPPSAGRQELFKPTWQRAAARTSKSASASR